MKAMPDNPNRGSSFEDFLKEEGILEASTTTAVKWVLAWQIAEAMRTQHLNISPSQPWLPVCTPADPNWKDCSTQKRPGYHSKRSNVLLLSSAESYGLSWCKL
jgi:hypothetical protein